MMPKALCDPLPATEELSDSYMEVLSQIFIEHEAEDATYISKATTDKDLRLDDSSLIESRRSPP